jgi:hypothetical protein
MTTETPGTHAIEEHPDITALRLRYEQAAETPTAQIADGLTFLGGLYLAMSPWVIGFTDHSSLTANNLFTGVALAMLALGFAAAYERTHGIAWVAPVIGLWTIVAPWVVSGPTPDTDAMVSNIVVGVLCVLFSMAAMSVTMRPAGARARGFPARRGASTKP